MKYMLEFIDMSGQRGADIQSDVKTAEKLRNGAAGAALSRAPDRSAVQVLCWPEASATKNVPLGLQ